MSRRISLALVAAVVAVALGGLWIALGTSRAPVPPGRATTAILGRSIEDLLMDLQVVPLAGQAPEPFTLARLGGGTLSLDDLKGRPALLYFWATW